MRISLFVTRGRFIPNLAALLIAAANAMTALDAAPIVTKPAMLQEVVRNLVRPDYQELAATSQALTTSLDQLRKTPTGQALAQARAAWLATLLAARQVQWLQTGPIADRECLATYYYSKVFPHRIEEVLHSARPLDDAYLTELGAASKGLFTMEYLLFPSRPEPKAKASNLPASPPGDLLGSNDARPLQFLLALAREVQRKSELVAADWQGTNRQDVSTKFVAGGQDTLNVLVNQLARNLETIAEARLNFVLQLPPPVMRQLDRIEGARSGTSLAQLVALLRGTQRVYRGGEGLGIDDYLGALNPALELRVAEKFQQALVALQAIEAPLEEAVTDRKVYVQRAYQAIHELEILFKVDVASALGVTIMFNSNDGD